MRPREDLRGPMADAEGNAQQGDGDDTDEDRAADTLDHQNRDQKDSQSREKHLRIRSFSERHERGRVRHDDIRVAKSDEGDEEADAGGGAVLQAIGYSIDDLLADVRERENQKQHAG